MNNDSKINKLLTMLIRLTNDDKLTWSVCDPPNSITNGTDNYVPIYFETKYKSRHMAIFQHRYQGYNPDMDTTFWNEVTVFAILDDEGRLLLEKEYSSPAFGDLMNIVREKTANIDDILNELVQDGI